MTASATVDVPVSGVPELWGAAPGEHGGPREHPSELSAPAGAAPSTCSGEDAVTPMCDADEAGGEAPLEDEEPPAARGEDEAPHAANERGAPGESSGKERLPTQRITLEMLSRGGFYDMPMAKAARILGRTEGSFQRVCRGLGILRWPYRVRKSLQAIMAKTEEYLDDTAEEDGMSKAEVLRTLQARMDDIKGISGNGMDKATKQYRQYIFKLNHKLARRGAKGAEAAGEPPEAGALKAKGILRAASRIQPQKEASGSGGSGSDLARPRPRHARDLPGGGLALPGLAGADAPPQPRRTATAEEYQKACLQDNLELVRLCGEMDRHLAAAQEALAMRAPAFPAALPPALAASLLLPPGALAGLPGALAGLAGGLQLPGLAPPPPLGWAPQQTQPPGSGPPAFPPPR